MIQLVQTNDKLCDEKKLQKILPSFKQMGRKVAPLYYANILFDEDRLLNFLEQSKQQKIKSYISIDVFTGDDRIIPSLVSEEFKYIYRDFFSRLLSTIASYKDSVHCIIPELPYPYLPLFADKIIDYSAIALFSKFLQERYTNSFYVKDIYADFFESGRIPSGHFPLGKRRLIYLNDLNDFVYYYFNEFYSSVLNVDNLFIHKPVIIPNIDLGYEIKDISTGLLDLQPEIKGIEGGIFDFIKYTKVLADDNVAGGLFLKDGSMPKQSRDEFYGIMKSIDTTNELCFFIPIEYLKSTNKEVINSGIFTDAVPAGYPDVTDLYNKWSEIVSSSSGKMSFTYNEKSFDKFKYIFVVSAEWMNAKWEEQIIKACRNGATIFITPCIPKYNQYGALSGIIKEELLKSQEIIFGYESFVKLYKIGGGRLILFPQDNINANEAVKLKALYQMVCDL